MERGDRKRGRAGARIITAIFRLSACALFYVSPLALKNADIAAILAPLSTASREILTCILQESPGIREEAPTTKGYSLVVGFDTVLRTGSRLALSGGPQSPESKPEGRIVHEVVESS
jgi:hypothetical protein